MKESLVNEIIESELKQKSNLSEYALKDTEAIRNKDITPDIRLDFQRDIDRIMYSNSYTRYLGKTQVYTIYEEDHISRRSTHVQFVSRASRTIARALNLNEDLCEAIALGHDIGHVPFGHMGERVLNEISLKHTGKIFAHNVQSVRNLEYLEENGKGLNLTVQVLDGILCHNGEMLYREYKPIKKTKEEFFKEYNECYESIENVKKLIPMTLEGCVVRISDIIGYIGKDIEDAITINRLKREELPKKITKILGNTNSQIMDTIIENIIENSYGKGYISMSEKVYNAMQDMLKFNYENIYSTAYTEEEKEKCKDMFYSLFDTYLKALNEKDETSDIYNVFVKLMSDEYLKNTSNERIVIDFIAGMTDRYMFAQYEKYKIKEE
ncbi:MAG: HD domain-containing protein [Clostridia bacterium]|nr:HD domain-containing protein [Clostridia bacterium]